MRQRSERVERFAGLSDRDAPAQLTQWESPDLLNVEFYEGFAGKRSGYTRVNSEPFRDCSVRFDGRQDFLRIPNATAYTLSEARHIAIKVELLEQLRALGFVYSIATKGYGTGSNLEWSIEYKRIGGATDAGWWFTFYDAVDAAATAAPGLVALAISDGSTDNPPVGQPRWIEWNGETFRVYREDGTEVGSVSHTSVATTFITSAEPIYLGVNVASQDTPGTQYSAFKWNEFRYGDYTPSPSASLPGMPNSVRFNALTSQAVAAQAINTAWPMKRLAGYGDLVGYWPGDDGRDNLVTDKVGANHAVPGYTGPKWEYDPTLVLGPSGLRFSGQNGVAVIQQSQANIDFLWNFPGGILNSLTFSLHCNLQLATGETTIRNQTLLKMGTAASPQPLQIDISSNTLRALYHNGTTLYTNSISNFTASYAGKNIAIVVDFIGFNISTAQFNLKVFDLDGVSFGPVGFATQSVSGANPTARSTNWSLGASLGSFAAPLTPLSVANGVLDDFRVYTYANAASLAPQLNATSYAVEANPGNPGLGYRLPLYYRFNEGSGHTPQNSGDFAATAYLYPESASGVRWCSGLVEPEEPVEIRLIYDYRRFAQGSLQGVQRRAIVVSGCTVSELDFATGDVRILCGGIQKDGLLTATQYNDTVFIAGQNGQRPFALRGSTLHPVGIEAPAAPLSGVLVTGGAGTFTAGTYTFYYTYYNAQLGAESNPSPGFDVALVLNDRVTGFSLPVSADEQVSSRRVYCSLAGAPGAAWLVAEVTDNTQTAVTGLTINNVSTSALALEFTANGPAPAGSVVQIFSDYLFVGGNQAEPTRLFFSQAANPFAFATLDYVVLDTDSGDPITAAKPRLEVLQVYTRDSRWNVWPSGLSTAPINARQASATEGTVSPHSVIEQDKEHFVVGERNIYKTDGFSAVSISSPPRLPPGQPSPSIQKTLREGVNDPLRSKIVAAAHRSKDQMWFAYPEDGATRNTGLLIYDTTRGIWSKYDIPCDFLVEIEDGSDSPWIYGGVRGYVCRLDAGDYDGGDFQVFTQLDANTLYFDASQPLLVTPVASRSMKGRKIWIFRASTKTIHELEVVDVDGTKIYTTTVDFNYNTGDVALIGSVSWFIDFVVGASQATKEKRLQWVTFALANTGASNTNDLALRLFGKQDQFTHATDFSSGSQLFYELIPGTKSTHRSRFAVGGSGSTWRIRVTHTPIADTAISHTLQPATALPSNARWSIVELVSEWIETDAR